MNFNQWVSIPNTRYSESLRGSRKIKIARLESGRDANRNDQSRSRSEQGISGRLAEEGVCLLMESLFPEIEIEKPDYTVWTSEESRKRARSPDLKSKNGPSFSVKSWMSSSIFTTDEGTGPSILIERDVIIPRKNSLGVPFQTDLTWESRKTRNSNVGWDKIEDYPHDHPDDLPIMIVEVDDSQQQHWAQDSCNLANDDNLVLESRAKIKILGFMLFEDIKGTFIQEQQKTKRPFARKPKKPIPKYAYFINQINHLIRSDVQNLDRNEKGYWIDPDDFLDIKF